MPTVQPFALDQWVQKHRPQTSTKLTDSNVCPLSLNQLQQLSPDPSASILSPDTELSYGTIRGSPALRSAIAADYNRYGGTQIAPEDILVTQGAISANFLALDTLVGPGDHVIVQVPTYQQLYEVPKRAGAEVSFWRGKEELGWCPDIDELEGLIRDDTKMIVINTPNNPTGSILPLSTLQHIIALALPRSIIILADEVYHPLFHTSSSSPSSSPSFPSPSPPLLTLGYPHSISTSSLSKSYALPGLRLGWLATPSHTLLTALASARDYTTISVSQVDDAIATYTLGAGTREAVLNRSLQICAENIRVVEELVAAHKGVDWVRPAGGGTAMVRVRRKGREVEDGGFARGLLKETGVLVVPAGECFGVEGVGLRGWFRVGVGVERGVFGRGMGLFGEYLTKNRL